MFFFKEGDFVDPLNDVFQMLRHIGGDCIRAIYSNWLQPLLSAAMRQVSIEDCTA